MVNGISAADETKNKVIRDVYSNTWGITDALGRAFSSDNVSADKRTCKAVGIFYHLITGGNIASLDPKAPRNCSEIIRNNSDALVNSKLWGPSKTAHFWGEPLLGYYDMNNDEYVIRKHAQMLADAGVDTIIIDYTNFFANGSFHKDTYRKQDFTKLCDIYTEMKSEGKVVPQITLMLTWDPNLAANAFQYFYDDFFSVPKYENLWFKWQEKILVIGSEQYIKDSYMGDFTFRAAWPFYGEVTEKNSWPWLSVYPQTPGYTKDNDCEVIAVSVAQNWHDGLSGKEFCFFSDQDKDGNFIAQGRSFTYGNKKLYKNPVSEEYESKSGVNFQQQWERAFSLDPDFIFITGWNECGAVRFTDKNYPAFGKFCDQFTTEFSRDIEPTSEDELGDNFYCQMAINIRRFKGNGELKDAPQSKEIEIDGAFADWDSVALEYRDDIGDKTIRDAKGFGSKSYKNDTGRNDFTTMKVTYDKTNMYFYVETKDSITDHSENGWMNLLIGIDSSFDKPNWEGYHYILNNENVGDGITRLKRCLGGWTWEIADDFVKYKVSGNRMEIAIPRSSLEIENKDEVNIRFKWIDNIQLEGDVLKFYVDGDAAPNGRFYYIYNTAVQSKDNSKIILVMIIISLGILITGCLITLVIIKNKNKKV